MTVMNLPAVPTLTALSLALAMMDLMTLMVTAQSAIKLTNVPMDAIPATNSPLAPTLISLLTTQLDSNVHALKALLVMVSTVLTSMNVLMEPQNAQNTLPVLTTMV